VACLVLIVEDDPELREMMLAMLKSEGFDPMAASNGRDALSQLQHGPMPRLILLDLMMPVMDGWRFRETQRQSPPPIADIPVVVVSAIPTVDTKRLAPAAVFSKPVDFDRLLATVRTLC